MEINAFFALIAERVRAPLVELDEGVNEPRHWIAVADPVGVELTPLDDSAPLGAHEILESLIADGVEAAGYVTHVPGPPERLIAYVLIRDPRTSDVRQCGVDRQGGALSLTAWEHTV